jgi:hypothetical protein
MKVSGVMQFEELTAIEVDLVWEFQIEHSELQFEFAPASASISWESFGNLASLTRLAALLASPKRS